MGLRAASARRPYHPDVMAPALPDAAVQARTFNLPPESDPEPASPPDGAAKRRRGRDDDPGPRSLKIVSRFVFGVPDKGPNNMDNDRMGLERTTNNVNKTKDDEQLFNANVDDIVQQMMKSIENSDQLNNSSTGDLTEVLDLNIDKELLEQVDNMINISIDDQQDELETAQKIKENQADILLSDLQRKHHRVERRLDFLRRRCHKLQSRLMGQHVSNEIVGVFEQVHRTVKKPKDYDGLNLYETPPFHDPIEKLKSLSVSSAKLLSRKLEMAKVLQANTASRQKNVPKYFGSGSIEASLFRNSTSGQVNIPQWTVAHKQELGKVADQLSVQFRIVQEELDSDATESSSGGESCDELQVYNNPHQQYLSIQKRALWKYSTERAAIAARWTWVQSQISDLEYRIRQHTDLHKQIRASKGTVQLDKVIIRPPPVQSQSEIAGHHDYGATPAESTNAATPLNGYIGQLPGASGGKTLDNDDCHYCARTRPLKLGSFKKRKLLQFAGLHAVAKKAARPSTMRCNCVAPNPPCALCTGRVDPTHPRDSPDTLGKAEKVSLLDPGYHPVLSLPEDTSETLHLEAIMKMYEWQQRSLKMKTMKILHKSERIESRPYEHRTKKLEHRKKYKLKPSTVTALTEKIKKKLRGRKVRPVGRPSKLSKRQNQAGSNPEPDAGGSEDAEVEDAIRSGSQLPGTTHSQVRSASFDSPGGSPLLQMQSITGYKQNNRVNRTDSYDIDNIVIPYSVAAATRVEKLQYKEILTPKWRILDENIRSETKNNGSVADFMEDGEVDVEDVSDEAVIGRHNRCELDEKKRFLSYVKFPLGYGRQRSHKRHDSLAESSGANTPDPASPHQDGGKGGSEADPKALVGSPPPTPVPWSEESLPSIAVLRRRTVSQSRFREVKEDGPQIDYVEQPPYDARTFPLADVEYERMIQDIPEGFREVKTNFRAQDTGGEDSVAKSEADQEIQESADSESTESAIGEDAMMEDEDEHFMEEDEEEEEDPNDPEWMDVEKSGHRDRHNRR